jgi:hypothetical protein
MMEEWGLAYFHNGNLQMVSHNKTEKDVSGMIAKHRCTIDTQGRNISTVSEMKKLLLLKLIECKARQIHHVHSSLKNEISNRFNEVNRENRDEIKGDFVSMSVTLIANELEISRSQAQSLLEWWEKMKYIEKIKGRKRAAHLVEGSSIKTVRVPGAAKKVVGDIMQKKFGYGYWWKNLYIVVEPNFLAFLSFPIGKDSISFRQKQKITASLGC